MSEDDAMQEEDALHVFLLMGKEYRISRSIRAQWFFEQFNKTLSHPKSHDDLIASNEELEVLSVISNNQDNHGPYKLVPSTQITFIGRRYKFVFCFDISPSLSTVDIQSGTVITSEAFEKFKNCLNGLVAPFSVPGNTIVLRPELYITVLAYTSILNPEVPQILIQGCLVTEENINFVLETVHKQLMEQEDYLAKTMSMPYCDTCSSDEMNKTESDQRRLSHGPVPPMSPETGPMSILRNALLALQLLPGNASAGAVVITDGVFALPDAMAVDSLMAQLRASTVCCSFIKVGSGFHAHCSFGYVPHCDMMQFIAMATSGAYLAKAPPVSKDGKKVDECGKHSLNCKMCKKIFWMENDYQISGHPRCKNLMRFSLFYEDFSMNLYHKALLCWNFQRDFDLSKIDSWIGDCLELSEEDLAWALKGKRSLSYALSEWEQNAMQPSMPKRHLETKLQTSITSVLSVRLREGYSIQDVSIAKGGKQLQVKLTIPWKHNVQIEYLALSTWPLSSSSCVTHVEVTIEAPYEFLHDVMHFTKPFQSPYRTLVVKRFQQFMKSLQSTDQMLVHLQSFSSNPIYYTIPESVKKGVPLFYLPPNSNELVLSLQHGSKNSKSQESQFSVFWKPVLSLDTTGWQRWMHCHRIGLVLEHDVPLPKNLHLPMENDRSSAIQCRVALRSLTSLLRNWSSFVLLENHCYIKFIASENPEGAPSSFCIVRITASGPCILIKVAFLGGTAGHIRHTIVSGLKKELSEITAPLGANVKPQNTQAKGRSLQRAVTLSKQRTVDEKLCAIMYEKSLDGIYVRYERVPKDLFSPFPEQLSYFVYGSSTGLYAFGARENRMKLLCQYLHHRRWIWTMQDEKSTPLSAEKVARVLSTLTKVRLQEGYNFVNNSAGIITMAKELKMKDHTQDSDQLYSCVIQYVLFPPYPQSSESERREESVHDWASVGKTGRKFNMVTEVWAEPQFGCLTDLKTELKYLEGLQYDQIPDAIYQADVKHVSALLTYDHLVSMCDDKTVTTPHRPLQAPEESSILSKSNWIVEQPPFPFDIIDLLPKTRQVEMVFSSLIETSSQASDDLNVLPNENFFKLLIENMERLNDREVILSDDDWNRFTQHILTRPRYDVPLPFPEGLWQRKDSGDTTQDSKEKKSKNKSTSSMKWRCFIRAVTALGGGRIILTFLPASFKHIRLMGRRQRSRSSSVRNNSSSSHSASEAEHKGATDERSPYGTCEPQKLSVPLLSQGSLEDQSLTPTPTAEKDEGPFVFSQKTRNSPVLNGNSEMPVNNGDEKRSVTFQENSTSINKEPVFYDRGFGQESDSFSFDIPIYCYDCPMSALVAIPDANSDTERTSEEKREDIFQDFTQFAAHIFADPFSLDEVPRSLEGRSKGKFGPSKDLLLHCSAVHDLFFRSFVTSTFLSLQQGQQVSMRDVQSAVDACEENFLEVDITEFIHTLCGHYVKSNKTREAFFETTIDEDLLSVPIWLPSESSEERVRDLKESLVGQCESVNGLHKSITGKFFSILGRYFKAVPPSREYFFYCPQLSEGPRKSVPESFSEFEPFEVDQVAEDDFKERDSDVDSDAFDDDDDDDNIFMEDEGTVQQDEVEDMPDYESQASDSECEGDVDFVKEMKIPFFLQLTCSLKDTRSHGQPMTPVSINTLPVCLGEIIRKFEDDDECLDPFSPSIRITLDLICLTLPVEHDYSVLKSSVRCSQARSNSFSSTSSPASVSPSDKRSGVFDFRRQDSKATSHDMERIESLDPLHGLVNSQRQAVNNTCEAIRWLIQDEIVSELRHIGPVNNSMLEKVEQHVQQSEDHPSCISRLVRLQFVFGAEQSLELFVKEFERISLPEYVLKNVDKYYYLTSFIEKQVAALSPLTLGENGDDLDKQQEEEATTPNPESNSENGDQTTLPQLDVQTTPESHTSANDGLLTIYIGKHSTNSQHEEVAVNNLRENEMNTPPSRPPHLGQLGKQHSEEEEEPGSTHASTPLNDASFASSAGSTPLQKLIMPGEGVGAADLSNTKAEEDDSCSPSPCTPRQDKQIVPSAELCLKFWLVMKILDSEVNIVFHQRESDDAKSFCATRANGLVEMVTNAVHEKCRIVNQRMLLHELYETKMCNSMLFPESDEDIWKHEEIQMSVSPLGVHMTKGDSKGRVTSKFVPVQFLFQPGHFGCDSKWYTHLPVHQRLFEASARTGMSRGLKVIKSVLDKFEVKNRKDMFVYKESAGSVFYFRLFESLCSSSNQFASNLRPSEEDDDDESRPGSSVASLAGSRTSSQWSLVHREPGDTEEDAEVKSKKPSTAQEQDAISVHSAQPVIDKSIALHVYGVDDPGPQITEDLVEVLQNRINDAMVEVLSVLLARNPNCKLTYADVRFIQPQSEPPKTTLTLLIPKMDVNFLCPLVFYLRQNLLQLLHSPRYMDSDPSHHFKAVSGSKLDATGSAGGESRKLEPEIYLYNRPHSSGGKGLACISVSVLNWRGGYIYIPCGKSVCVYAGEIDYFEYLTEVSSCPDELHLADDDIKVQFAIWERGDIGLNQLAGQLKLTLRHALCDLLTEYYLLAAPLSKVPKLYQISSNTRARSSSEPLSPSSILPKAPTHLGSLPERPATPSKRQLDFGSQSSFRNKRASVSGHRRSPSAGSTLSSGSTGATRKSPQNPFLSQRQSVSTPNAVSRQSTEEDEVFQTDSTSLGADVTEVSAEENKADSQGVTESTDELNPKELTRRGEVTSEGKDKLGLKKASEKPDNSSDMEPTFESFTAAEIQESQKFTSQPGTPVTENAAFLSKKEEQLSEKLNKPSSLSSASSLSGSKSFTFSGVDSSSVGGQSSDVQGTWQDAEAVRRKEREKKKRRIQFENGERGELHPSLQGLCQDMFSFFRGLAVPSVYCIEGKLLNNFASDAFLAELCHSISSVCPDMKPKVYREAPVNSADGNEGDFSQEFHCLHYYPARQPLKVQDIEESTTDKSGKPFTSLPNSSQFFVVVGRNVDQWRASLGLEEDLSQDDTLGRPRIRTSLQRFKALDPNAPVPGRILADSVSLSSLSLGGVPRQKFLLVTVMDKEVTAFTYNWASELNTTFDKQLHRLINWSNARCHLTYCLLSQKMGLYHHTLFTDINKDKESKDMNPFCLSANDKDMSLLISYPGPYVPDRERAVPRSMPPSPSILVFDEVLRDVTPPRPLYRTSYSHNRDLVKRHGYQFQEVRQVQIKKAILAQNLEELYIMWQLRPPHVHITEDKIETLKRSSRLIHYCAAPLLFHPEWRKLRSSTGSEHTTVTPDEPSSEEKKQETKERKTSKVQKTIDEMKNEKTAVEAEKKPPTEEAWHKELRSAYLQQYVQYMQSLCFIVVQTRPQSPKQSRRHLGRGAVNTKPKRETSPADLKKKSSSKDRKDSLPKALQCYLQKTSRGGIMLMELVFQGCFFIVRLYALGCSQIPSGKTVAVQICRMFVEDCNRYREYIHLLSFNYDFHLCKAQLYLNGSQRIFNKGYGVTHMLKGLLQEYLNSPVFARNRLGYGEISVPLHPGVTPRVVFNYLVKNASFYDFSTLPVKTTNASSCNTDRVLTHILREYNDYDVRFVLSLKETNEEGVVTLEYIVLMTSRREIYPKLTLDLRLTKKSPSAGSLSTVSSGSRTVGLPEYGETEQEIASRVRFNLPTGSSQGIPSLPSLGEFHRSASSPHSLYALGHEVSSKILNVTSSRSDEKIGDYHRNVLPPIAPIPEHYEEELPENVALPESTLLKEASLRGRDHLVHIICRAQTHCNRDLLWHRLLAGETGDEEKDGGKKSRRKSVMRKSNSETSLKQSWAKSLDTLSPGADQMSPSRLTFEDFKHLLSVVGSKSLREEDPRLISLLSMRAAWFQSLFRVICAKFPDEHRLFTDEDHLVHYLAVLNRDFPNMFVLLYVDEHNDSADISVVFREDLPDNKESSHRSRLLKKEVRSHVYGVINAVCFHLWTGLLPV